ncbi:anti sigma-E factor RseA C-terminal domain-containing protein, partial [Klebsiella pneumoniae]|uniref:anti sigma-E factor RseA C-terminal domain-containing protein n=1 Tax=Klebsiella pneumoniae TaxID=573 RepID=UPI00272E399A
GRGVPGGPHRGDYAGKASPVSLGVPADASAGSGQQAQVQEQRRRINAMLQDYELQRRLHAEQLQFGQAQTQQAAVQVPHRCQTGGAPAGRAGG